MFIRGHKGCRGGRHIEVENQMNKSLEHVIQVFYVGLRHLGMLAVMYGSHGYCRKSRLCQPFTVGLFQRFLGAW